MYLGYSLPPRSLQPSFQVYTAQENCIMIRRGKRESGIDRIHRNWAIHEAVWWVVRLYGAFSLHSAPANSLPHWLFWFNSFVLYLYVHDLSIPRKQPIKLRLARNWKLCMARNSHRSYGVCAGSLVRSPSHTFRYILTVKNVKLAWHIESSCSSVTAHVLLVFLYLYGGSGGRTTNYFIELNDRIIGSCENVAKNIFQGSNAKSLRH